MKKDMNEVMFMHLFKNRNLLNQNIWQTVRCLIKIYELMSDFYLFSLGGLGSEL